MRKSYKKLEVSCKEEYEETYRATKKEINRVIRIYNLFCIAEIVAICIALIVIGFVYNYNLTFVDIMSPFIGVGIRLLLLGFVGEYPWHENILECADREARKKTLPYAFVVFITTCVGINAVGSILGLISTFILIFYIGEWWLIFLIIELSVNAVIMPFILFHLKKYFRYYRWTWEELQLPIKERKAQRKAKRLAEKQKKSEERKARRQAAKSQSAASGDFFAKQADKPAARTVKSQADRRAELENLKKLYDEGLIDEEEYKKAREKTLGI